MQVIRRLKVNFPIIHLIVSIGIFGILSSLVIFVWFPDGIHRITGGIDILWLIFGVDIVLGPLLSFIVVRPGKSKKAIIFDVACILTTQIAALLYGLYSLSYAKPIAFVYEVDRFRVVTFADLDVGDAGNFPNWVQPFGFSAIRTIGLRPSADVQELMQNFDRSMQGIEPSQRPSQWQEYRFSAPYVLRRSKSAGALIKKHPTQVEFIEKSFQKAALNIKKGETSDPNSIVWLPLVGKRHADFVVMLDPVTARIRGIAKIDGFD